MIKKVEIIFTLIIVKHCMFNTDSLPEHLFSPGCKDLRQVKIESIVKWYEQLLYIQDFFLYNQIYGEKNDQIDL